MRGLMVVGLALLVSACGDPDTEDRRGYTKAPLENPGLLVEGEEATVMARLGRPDLPRPLEDLEEAEPAGAEEEPAGATDDGGAEPVTLAEGVTQEQFDQGAQLFSGQGGCQACHGPNGTGSQLGPDLSDAEWLHVSGADVQELAEVITSGVQNPQQYPAPMPPMGGASLTEAQVQALAAYVASIGQGS